jgi:hypothetical protein
MVQNCAVKGCERQDFGNGITYHRFPMNDFGLSKTWMSFFDNANEDAMDVARLKSRRACGVHFLPEDYDSISPKMKLKP